MQGITRGLALVVACIVCAAPAAEPEFRVRLVQTEVVGGVYLLNARVDFALSPVALEALDSGVPLTLLFEIRVKRQRSYLWDENVATLEQRYRLVYHALSGRYLVLNLNTGISQTYPDLDDALAALGTIRGYPLIDSNLMDENERYQGQLRVKLDIEALPAPLRPLAYFNPNWRLSSNEYRWPLHP